MLKTTHTTRTIMVMANLIMKGVRYYNNVKYKNNYDYFVRDIRQEYPNLYSYKETVGKEPFFQKSIIDNDATQIYAVIKIGDCYIEYSYEKLNWGEQLQDAFNNMKKNFLAELITLTKSSHYSKSPSVYLKKINGKETGDVT